MFVGMLLMARGNVGMIEASTTRRPSTPLSNLYQSGDPQAAQVMNAQSGIDYRSRITAHFAGAGRMIDRLRDLPCAFQDILVLYNIGTR